MKSISQHQFSRVPSANISRSTLKRWSAFKRSHGYKTIINSVYVDEALSGDTFNLKIFTNANSAPNQESLRQ